MNKRIFNQEKTQEIQDYDLSKGKLIEDTLEHIIPEVLGQEEKSESRLIATYPNGGSEWERVIIQPKIEYQPQRIEYEDILKYVPFTQEELNQIQQEEERKQQILLQQQKQQEFDIIFFQKQDILMDYDTWFNDYDQKISQFTRKKLLYENSLLTIADFNKEKEKINKWNFEAEKKAKEVKQLREEYEKLVQERTKLYNE